MSAETPEPRETTPAAQHARRTPGVKPPPLKVDMSKVPPPRWLKHSVTAIDVFAGVLCAIVVRWMGPLVLSPLDLPLGAGATHFVLVAGIAALGWLIRRRAWAISFVAGTIAIPLGLLPLG